MPSRICTGSHSQVSQHERNVIKKLEPETKLQQMYSKGSAPGKAPRVKTYLLNSNRRSPSFISIDNTQAHSAGRVHVRME